MPVCYRVKSDGTKELDSSHPTNHCLYKSPQFSSKLFLYLSVQGLEAKKKMQEIESLVTRLSLLVMRFAHETRVADFLPRLVFVAVLLGLQENLSVKCIIASIHFPLKKGTKSSGNDLACLPDQAFILSLMILIFLESIKRSAIRLSEGQTKQHTKYEYKQG